MPVPQTPQDAIPTAAPFVVQVDAPEYSAPQRIPADGQAKKTADEDDKSVSWEFGLFGCFSSWGSMCAACWVPCFSAGDTLTRINSWGSVVLVLMVVLFGGAVVLFLVFHNQPKTEIRTMYYGKYSQDREFNLDPYFGHLLGALACVLAYLVLIGVTRTQVRHAYRIYGWWVSDCCAAFWCSCCALAQASAHVRAAEKKKAKQAATLPGYVAAYDFQCQE